MTQTGPNDARRVVFGYRYVILFFFHFLYILTNNFGYI
jgi:hypothetical protein